jgi:uncharacterized protein (TIGR02118 family)
VIKSVSLLTRREGMSVEDFQTYWREVHGPIAARIPGLRRYVQCATLPELYAEESPPDFDGVAELWWDNIEAMQQARATPESEATAADASNFLAGSVRLIVSEVPLIDAFPSPKDRQAMVKYIAMLMRKDGVPVEDFQRHWRDVHGPINVKAIPTMQRYVQSHVLPETYNADTPPAFDGLPEAWFDSVAAFRDRPRDPNAPRDLEWTNFCKGQKQIFAREVIIVD